MFAIQLIEDPDARSHLAGGRTPRMPSGLTSVLARHLDLLEAPDRSVIEWAAIAGDPLDLPLLVAASRRSVVNIA